MTCYHPITAYKCGSYSQGFTIIHNPVKGEKLGGTKFEHPCGQCIGCRLDKALEWSVRSYHEASLYPNNCFITLTFSEEYLKTRPNPWSIQRGAGSEFTNFMKRLRKKYVPKNPHEKGTDEYEIFKQLHQIRFYMCGEYGENCYTCFKNEKNCSCTKYVPTIGRPHYHALLFNHDFDDKTHWKTTNGIRLYTSDSLQNLWTCPKSKIPMGFTSIGDVTIDSAGYVARYTTKKITGRKADELDENGFRHYERFDPRTGEIHLLEPEYNNMSRMPGIGKNWLEKYSKEVLVNDSVISKSYPVPVPRYYDKLLEEIDPDWLEENKTIRLDNAEKHADNNTTERLAVREMIQERKTTFLPRKEI